MAGLVANAVDWVSHGAVAPAIASFDSKVPNGFPDTVIDVPTSDLATGTYVHT